MPLEPPVHTPRARTMTRAMREEPWWAPLRAELARRGMDPARVVLVDAFDDEEDVDVGLLYTDDQRLIAWRHRYCESDPEEDRFLEWRDVTDGWAGTLWSETAATYLQAVRHTRRA